MKLAFFPGKLFLDTADDGTARITLDGREVLRTRSKRAAVAKFNALRKELGGKLPAVEPSAEDKAEAFRRMLLDSMVQHNSLGGRQKKSSARGTRTFGG